MQGENRLEHQELTGRIIAAAIKVHKALGPGFIESIYENALVYELQKQGFKVRQQVKVRVYYEDLMVGRHRLDLFVEDQIIVELKAIKQVLDLHFAIVRSYLRAMNQKHALMMNFAKTTLEVKRVISK